MVTHKSLWAALDRLAIRHRLTPSGLARRAGLDATAFNPSKRSGQDGRERWPSTESIAKVLEVTGTSAKDFFETVEIGDTRQRAAIPMIGSAQAGADGFFDEAGLPISSNWNEVDFPNFQKHSLYALEIAGDSMLPFYRSGDTIIVAPFAAIRRNDRVIIKTKGGEIMAKIMARRTKKTVEVRSFNSEQPLRVLNAKEIEWMARIIWASQ